MEHLNETTLKLADARTDLRQTERETKSKEALSGLKRAFPSGVYGRISDLCKPTQKKFEVPISILLGKNMDAIVVESQKLAIDCIGFLRDQRSGLGTFIPLDSIQVRKCGGVPCRRYGWKCSS